MKIDVFKNTGVLGKFLLLPPPLWMPLAMVFCYICGTLGKTCVLVTNKSNIFRLITIKELKKTCTFYRIAFSRRVNAQMLWIDYKNNKLKYILNGLGY